MLFHLYFRFQTPIVDLQLTPTMHSVHISSIVFLDPTNASLVLRFPSVPCIEGSKTQEAIADRICRDACFMAPIGGPTIAREATMSVMLRSGAILVQLWLFSASHATDFTARWPKQRALSQE